MSAVQLPGSIYIMGVLDYFSGCFSERIGRYISKVRSEKIYGSDLVAVTGRGDGEDVVCASLLP